MKQSEGFNNMMAHLAVGCLNIDEEKHKTFEQGSRFHVALGRLMAEVNEERVGEFGELLAAVNECVPDLEHYASTHGPGPDRRLDALRGALDGKRGRRSLESAIRGSFPGFEGDAPVNGADLVDFVSEWLS